MQRALIFLVPLITACGAAAPPEPAEPRTADSVVTVTPPVPDPIRVLPDTDLVVQVVDHRARSRDLVAVGKALRDDAEYSASIDRFEEAIEADSTNLEARWELGWTLQLDRRFAGALAAWRRLASASPSYPGISRYLPIVEMRRDRAAALAALPAGADVVPPETEPRPGDRIRVAAVGDITLGSGWPEERAELSPDGAAPIFERVAPHLRTADITFGNLETVLADSGASGKCRPSSTTCYAFRVPTSYAADIRRAGFTHLSINNNHAGDFGEPGRATTARALAQAGMAFAGPSAGIASWETNGVTIALVAFSTGDGPYRIQEIASARRFVIDADRDHDLVFVSFHGGAEGAGATRVPKEREQAYGEDRGDVYAFARSMVDAGADLVLGHGPHVLRGMEVYNGRLIAYSLGNFSSWENFNLRGPLGLSVILYATIAPNGVITEAEILPVYLADPGIPTPDGQGRAVDIVRTLSGEDLGAQLFDDNGTWRRR